MPRPNPPPVEGFVAEGFEPVRQAFIENFAHRGELGGAVCIYQNGEKVVDLWGGLRDRRTEEPWQRDTMAIVHSSTKGLSAMVMALAHSRGWLDYDERVATYWPEFAKNGKERITIRQLLAHQAGLFAFDEPVDRDVIADLDRLAQVMARQHPAWAPGERQAYHAISLGFYEGELIRRVDPDHRSLGQVFDDEIRKPLGIDAYIRVPEEIPSARIAPLEPPNPWKRMTGMPLPVVLDAMRPHSVLHRSLVSNPGTGFYLDPDCVVVRNLEAPSGGGIANARALARAYGVFATDGRELGLRPETLEALAAPASPSLHWILRRVLPRPGTVLPRLHETERVGPFRSPPRFRRTGSRGVDGLRRSGNRHRLRLRHEPHGRPPQWRPAGRRVAGGDPDRQTANGRFRDRSRVRARCSDRRLMTSRGDTMAKSFPRLVSEVMTKDVVSVSEDDNLSNLLESMHAMHFRHTPVTDGDRLVGLLTERDLLRTSSSSLLPHRDSDNFLQKRFLVRDVMIRDVATVSPSTPLKDAGQLMLQRSIGCLPVVDDQNVLVGILTSSDLLEVAVSLLPDAPG